MSGVKEQLSKAAVAEEEWPLCELPEFDVAAVSRALQDVEQGGRLAFPGLNKEPCKAWICFRMPSKREP